MSARVVPENLFLTINVSPSELCAGNLAALISRTSDQLGFRPERLIVEVTEAGVIQDAKAALTAAAELREMGCRLALDDFGTGHSSLTYLQQLPFYCLKIDRSFVAPMVSQRQSRKIVASVIGLSINLAMRCVGEGVETAEQADLLLWLGCDLAQGWLYGRPESAEALPRLVSTEYSSARLMPELGDDSLHALPTQRLAQLQAIYRGAPVGLGFLDMRQRYVSLNQKFAQVVGKPKESFAGKTVKEMVPETYPVIAPLLARAYSGESVVNEEISLSGTDTRPIGITVLVSYEPVREEMGEVVGVSVAILDISGRLAPSDVPSSADAWDVVDATSDTEMPWARDEKGNLTQVSPKWIALTGMSREQSLNLGSLEAIHPEDRPLALSALREAVQSRTPIDVTCRVRTKSGDYRWLRARGHPRYEAGRFVGWYGGSEDLEEKTRLQSALHRESSHEEQT